MYYTVAIRINKIRSLVYSSNAALTRRMLQQGVDEQWVLGQTLHLFRQQIFQFHPPTHCVTGHLLYVTYFIFQSAPIQCQFVRNSFHSHSNMDASDCHVMDAWCLRYASRQINNETHIQVYHNTFHP